MDLYWWFILAFTLHLYSTSEALPFSILRLLSSNDTSVSSFNSTNAIVTPGKWPPLPAGRIDVPGSHLYILINAYDNPVPQSLTHDVISSLALIEAKIDSRGNPHEIMPKVFASNGRVKFHYSPRFPLPGIVLTRRELLRVIEELGGLILADGPRTIGRGYIYKYGVWVGLFDLSIETGESQGENDVSISKRAVAAYQ